MSTLSERIKMIGALKEIQNPSTQISYPRGKEVHPYMKLLAHDDVFGNALPEMYAHIGQWQKLPYLMEAIPLFAHIDPDELEIRHLLAEFQEDFRSVNNQHIGCRDKRIMAGRAFKNALAIRSEVDNYNRDMGSCAGSVGFILPAEVHFVQGEHAFYNPSEPDVRTELWVPPSLGNVASEVVELRGKRVTNYWSNIDLQPVGSDKIHSLEIGYSSADNEY